MLGTPAPTGREKPARLPLYLGFYQTIMVEKLEGDGDQGGRNPSFGGEDHSCSKRMLGDLWQRQRRHPGALVPIGVSHACPKAPVLEQPHAEILFSPAPVPKAPLAATGAAGTGTEQE